MSGRSIPLMSTTARAMGFRLRLPPTSACFFARAMPVAARMWQCHDLMRETACPAIPSRAVCRISVHRLRCKTVHGSVSRTILESRNSMSLVDRIAASFKASFGDIVFGMEDGTVSIFGLVFGVAASTNDTRVVLVAGMTGAIAAAVSMMAGAYLDAETARDQAREHAAEVDHELVADEVVRE